MSDTTMSWEQVAEGRGPAQLVPELLIGFDPVPQLLGLLDERYGHLAAFCVDRIGGASVGVRWKAAAFLPAPIKVRLQGTDGRRSR